MLYFPRWKIIAICRGVRARRALRALPNLFIAGAARLAAGLDAEEADDARPRSARRLAICCSRSMSPRPSTSGSTRSSTTSRNALRDAKIGYTGLSVEGDTVQLRDPRHADRRRRRAKQLRLAKLDPRARRRRSAPTAPATMQLQRRRRRTTPRARRRSTSRSRSSAAASTRPAPRSRSIQRQGTTASWCRCRASTDPEHLKELLGQTAKLTFQLVEPDVTVEEAQQRPPAAGRRDPAGSDERGTRRAGAYVVRKRVIVGGENLADAQATFDQRQRAGRHLPVRRARARAASATRPAECRQAVRHRARQQGDLRAGDPRADPRRQRHHLRQLHRADANDLALLLRAGALPAPTHHRRGAHGRRRASAPIRSMPARSPASSAVLARRRLHVVVLRPVRLLRRHRAGRSTSCLMLASLSLLGATLTCPASPASC